MGDRFLSVGPTAHPPLPAASPRQKGHAININTTRPRPPPIEHNLADFACTCTVYSITVATAARPWPSWTAWPLRVPVQCSAFRRRDDLAWLTQREIPKAGGPADHITSHQEQHSLTTSGCSTVPLASHLYHLLPPTEIHPPYRIHFVTSDLTARSSSTTNVSVHLIANRVGLFCINQSACLLPSSTRPPFIPAPPCIQPRESFSIPTARERPTFRPQSDQHSAWSKRRDENKKDPRASALTRSICENDQQPGFGAAGVSPPYGPSIHLSILVCFASPSGTPDHRREQPANDVHGYSQPNLRVTSNQPLCDEDNR